MNEEIQSNFLLKRYLSWVDLVIVLGGIVCIYIILAFGTFWFNGALAL